MTYKFDNHRISIALEKAKDTKYVYIDQGLLFEVNSIFAQCFGEKKAVVIADENTFAVAGKRVYEQLKLHDQIEGEPFIFPIEPMLYAEYPNVLLLEEFIKSHDAIPVVVGSGTLNDLTKLASFRCNKPYMIIATAASMDGYTAYGAAITKEGFKQTIPCSAPNVVLIDLDVIVKAPLRLTASGYGDLLGKITAGADWVIADHLGIDPIDDHAWALVQDSLRDAIDKPQLLKMGDVSSFGRLIEGLILCGLSMQAIQASRPASGSEHQFSHLWEMYETVHGVVSHGFKVGIGSIASAALYEQVLARNFQILNVSKVCAEWPNRSKVQAEVRNSFSDSRIAQEAVNHSMAKYIDSEPLASRLEMIKETWPSLKEKLERQLLSASKIFDLLLESGCPVHPTQIGYGLPHLKASYFLARKIRSRYTIFDFAAETGCFGECVDELFKTEGFWGKHPYDKEKYRKII